MPYSPTSSLNAALAGPPTPQQDMSPSFFGPDAFTARMEGGKTNNDGNGGAAAYGIDQNAHPGTMGLDPNQAQAMRYQYWNAISGSDIAKSNPKLALAAYDTAIMSGPQQAQSMLQQAGGDPNKFMQIRDQFLKQLGSRPAFHGALAGWNNRDDALQSQINQ